MIKSLSIMAASTAAFTGFTLTSGIHEHDTPLSVCHLDETKSEIVVDLGYYGTQKVVPATAVNENKYSGVHQDGVKVFYIKGQDSAADKCYGRRDGFGPFAQRYNYAIR